MEPILEVTQQGVRRYVAGEPVAAQPTALARIDPDAVVRQALDQQSATVQGYLKAVGSAATRTVDAAPRAPTGYSSEPELKARNSRYYVTIAAYLLVTAVLAFGLVQLAILADITPGDWFWPAWFTLSGALALGLIWLTHRSESERTPEGIELERVRSDGYATERQADGQHAIATAVAEAITWRAQAEYSDSQARQLATEEAYGRILPQRQLQPPQRQLTVSSDVTYGVTMPLQPATAAQGHDTTPQWTIAPAQPDTACLALCEAIQRLYADCAQRGDNLITSRLPWSQRGEWAAPQKRTAVDVLQRLDPPLLIAGDGGRWRLNRGEWPMPIALSAIRRRWPRD